MGIFDRSRDGAGRQAAPGPDDEQAIARYRYMLKTAPPETIEQAHTEAFARLTPEQRRMVLEELRALLPEAERKAMVPVVADPQTLARYATRAEIQQPGTLERAFGGMRTRDGVGIGGLLAGSFLGSMAGMVLGTMIAQRFLEHDAGSGAGGFDQHHAADDHSSDDTFDHGDHDVAGDIDLGDNFDI